MKSLFVIGGSSTAFEIRETFEQFYKDEYDAMYNVVSAMDNCPIAGIVHDPDLEDCLG